MHDVDVGTFQPQQLPRPEPAQATEQHEAWDIVGMMGGHRWSNAFLSGLPDRPLLDAERRKAIEVPANP
jgi:hypothetical protein